MKKSNTLPQGKLPIPILNQILKSIPSQGLLSPERIGMDAGVVAIKGNNIAFTSAVLTGAESGIGRGIVSDLAKKLSQEGFRPVLINPVLLLPEGTSQIKVSRLFLEISKATQKRCITIGKGHTEITSRVREITLIATMFGDDRQEGKGRRRKTS